MTTAEPPGSVLIADGETLFRQAVRTTLDTEPDLCVIADLGHGGDVMTEARNLRPDVFLLAADLAGCHPVDLIRDLVREYPSWRILLLMDQDDPEVLVEALRAGARGCVAKDTKLSYLIASVRLVRDGQMVIPPRILPEVIDLLIHQGDPRTDALRLIARLTARERIVLGLLCDGGNNQTIAKDLFISPLTARTHIQNLLAKLGVHSRLEAAMFVAQHSIGEELTGSSTLHLRQGTPVPVGG